MWKFLDWIDVASLSFNSLLLLEKVQLSWLPKGVPEQEMALALHANTEILEADLMHDNIIAQVSQSDIGYAHK